MITDIAEYFRQGCGRCDRFATPDCSTRAWIKGLNDLRRICLDAGLEETVKWAHPTYMHVGRNIAILGAFRGFRLTFMNAGLLNDTAGLAAAGPKQSNRRGRCNSPGCRSMRAKGDQALSPAIDGPCRGGHEAAKDDSDLEMPEELTDALDADPELAEAFSALTPGRQRSYAIALESGQAVRNAREAD